jgi:outer membrane protein assembly factor BamB
MHRLNALLSLLGFLCCDAGLAEDWFRHRGPNLNGVSPETDWSHDWPSGPKIAWKFNVGTGFSSIVVSEGRAYTIGNREDVDTVHCLDALTGQSHWQHAYASAIDPNEFAGGPTSTPTVDGDTVFTISRSGDVFAIDKTNGKVRWSLNVADQAEIRTPGWGFAGSPLVIGERVILNAGDAGVCLDRSTGKVLWSSADKECGYASPVPMTVNDKPAVILGSRSYVCVEVATGSELWRQRWLTTFGCNAADPLVHNGQVLLSSAYNRGSALFDVRSNETVWKSKDFQNHLCSSVLIGSSVYGAHGDIDAGTKLTSLDFKTGQVHWEDAEIKVGGLSAAADRLIVITSDGRLMILRANSSQAEILAAAQIVDSKCWTSPTLSGGLIYVRAADGEVVAVDVRNVR